MRISRKLSFTVITVSSNRKQTMANVTDPLIAQISGSDPQNLMEYITRQKIYDSRYWKEECFGLTVTNVLEKAAALQCLGTFPHTACLALLLKLLQLHPEHALIHSAFIAAPSTTFKYARALGSLYIRLTSRPVEIYTALEPLYADFRKLRVYNSGWSIVTMDEWIHSLLHVPSFTKTSTVLGLTLPRLATRRNLQDNGYLQLTTGLLLRPSDAVLSITIPSSTTALLPSTSTSDNSDHRDAPPEIRRVLELLHYQAHVEQCPAAMVAWKKRFANSKPDMNHSACNEAVRPSDSTASQQEPTQPKRKKSKDGRNYTNLFKSAKPTDSTSTTTTTAAAPPDTNAAPDASSEEACWNAQRAQLGLDKLK
jgi:pre-mRNA-splicing factor 38A